jgi:catechol 2,3-dioxygenase
MEQNSYKVPAQTRIGHVHLKVSNLKKALEFYNGLLGFEIKQFYGDAAAFLAAGPYHHHIGLNTWLSKDGGPAPRNTAGLFHLAIVYPERRDLAIIVKRLIDVSYPLTGASNHGVSEAVYLHDPDGNGLELYWDRPMEEWPMLDGQLNMVTLPLDMEGLLKLI